MQDVATLIGIVVVVTELIKKAFLKYLKIYIKGTAAIVLATLVSIGTVFVESLKADVPLSFSMLPILIQVILGSTIGYAVVTKKSTT